MLSVGLPVQSPWEGPVIACSRRLEYPRPQKCFLCCLSLGLQRLGQPLALIMFYSESIKTNDSFAVFHVLRSPYSGMLPVLWQSFPSIGGFPGWSIHVWEECLGSLTPSVAKVLLVSTIRVHAVRRLSCSSACLPLLSSASWSQQTPHFTSYPWQLSEELTKTHVRVCLMNNEWTN